ncbi:solute carrier family 22 member 16-like isoform X2 [Dendronephthya gigantea]|uniref:solute carrier family 22 member 16-like isoform X2 n=1 Tax=Dendronephthya gigantea TaxID=151771 RepID=UPI00106BD431|nr:solute carrier family 22 member 16-like isoform X2 [Dendronephthya gigantea]
MTVTIDEVFKKIGEFRRYQWYIITLIGYCTFAATAINGSIVAFIAAEPDWKCVEGYMNNTVCRFNTSITLTSKDYKARCKMPREAWTFVDDFTSIVTEYDLVCDDSILLSFAQSASWVGMLIGLPIGGLLSDKFGRRKLVFAGFLANVVAAIVVVYPKHFLVFIFCRLLFGFGYGFQNCSSYPLMMEYTTAKYRSWLSFVLFTFFTLGVATLPLIAFFAREWRTFALITAACAAPVLVIIWFIPESPRWLLLSDSEDKARKQLLKVANMNKRTLPDDALEKPINLQRASFRQLFSSWKVAKITLICWNLWFTVAHVYYGVSWGSVDLGGNRYLNFFLLMAVGLPANFLVIWTVDSLVTTMVASAISASIPADPTPANVGIRVTAAIIAKFSIGFCFVICYLWTSELYPTVIRSTGMSTSSAVARIGSFASSYVIWLIRVHSALPYSIFAVICLQAAVFALFLPESKGKATMETMRDLKATGKEKEIDLLVPTGNEKSNCVEKEVTRN